MAEIRVTIQVFSGGKVTVEIPDDIPISRLIPALVSKLGLPTVDASGTPKAYILDHRRSGNRLADTDTFRDSGIENGDDIFLSTALVAG